MCGNTLQRMIEASDVTTQRTEWVNRVQELVKDWRESVSEKVNSERLPICYRNGCVLRTN